LGLVRNTPWGGGPASAVAAVPVKRQPRRRVKTLATGGIETNPPTAEPVTIPATIGAVPVVVEVPAVEVEQVEVESLQVEPISCTVEALAWMEARNARADVEAKASERKGRRKATVAACEASQPLAVLDRTIAEAEAAIEQGKAFLARRAAEKEQEAADLATLPVERLRQSLAIARSVSDDPSVKQGSLHKSPNPSHKPHQASDHP
jgi:hypothetical protein